MLYPNPARDICYLDIEGIQTDYIYLFDIAGRLILTQKATGNRTEAINVSGIPAGIYQIKVGSKIVKLVVKP